MPSTMDQYLPIVLLLVLGVVFAAGSFLASTVLGPKRANSVKAGPYESGIVPRQAPAARFPVRFYLVSMIFIIFDIEVVFLYPWATIFVPLHLFGLGEMAAFAVVVFVSFAYLVSEGALDWGPGKHLGRPARIDQSRSTMATVKRVPRPEQVIESPKVRSLEEEGDTGGAGQPGMAAGTREEEVPSGA